MEKEKVDAYLMVNAKYFSNDKIVLIRERLLEADDSKYSLLLSLDLKDPTTLLIVSIFLGGLGIDRFMVGDIGIGVLKLLTAGVCGILTIIDWFLIMDKTREANFTKLLQIL